MALQDQIPYLLSIYQVWGQGQRKILILNVIGWAAILVDTALHFILVRWAISLVLYLGAAYT